MMNYDTFPLPLTNIDIMYIDWKSLNTTESRQCPGLFTNFFYNFFFFHCLMAYVSPVGML